MDPVIGVMKNLKKDWGKNEKALDIYLRQLGQWFLNSRLEWYQILLKIVDSLPWQYIGWLMGVLSKY